MEYPDFELDEDGKIVIIYPDSTEETEDLDGDEISDDETTVSDGNASLYIINQELALDPEAVYEVDNPNFEIINENLERLIQAQASSTGYLSTTIVDAFDRVVQGNNYDYYIAFRNSSDAYTAVMYLSDKFSKSGNSILLQDAMAVSFYRSYSGNTYYYYYQVSYPGDVQVNMNGNLMYYTNCVPGYPILGQEPAPGHYSGWFIPLAAVLIFVTLISLVRRKN